MVLFLGRMFIQGPDPWGAAEQGEGKGGDPRHTGGKGRASSASEEEAPSSGAW